MIDWVIRNYWRDVSHRSVLYYLYLLELASTGTPEEQLKSNHDQLAAMVSIQQGSFDALMNEYYKAGIIQDAETCRLSLDAIYPIERLFDATFGTHEPELLRYNGLRIFNSTEAERIKLWVEKASHDIDLFFCGISNMHITTKDDLDARRTKRIVTLQSGGTKPAMLWGLIGNARMTRMSETVELTDHRSNFLEERAQKVQEGREGYALDGVNAIAIIAAPTYDEAIAHQLQRDGKRTIGVVNLEGIFHYLETRKVRNGGDGKKELEETKQKNADVREQQYYAMLNALRSFHGLAPSGVIDCILIGQYLDDVLKDLYATHRVTITGKFGE